MIFELSEATLRVERHGIQVDRMHYHDFESDVSGGLCDLAQRMKQQLRADAAAMEASVDCEAR